MDAFEAAKSLNKKEAEVKFCPNCGAEMNEENKCSKCNCEFGVIKEDESKEKYHHHHLKNFILKYGRMLVDFDTYVWFIIAFIPTIVFLTAFVGSYLPNNEGYFEYIEHAPIYLILAILLPIVIILIIILIKYFTYLLIDIKDALKNIEENTRKED